MQFQREMCYPPDEYTRQQRIYDSTSRPCDAETKKRIQRLIAGDPLHEFSVEEIELLREHRVRRAPPTAVVNQWGGHDVVTAVSRRQLLDCLQSHLCSCLCLQEQFKGEPAALSKCLRAVDWRSHEAVYDVFDMLSSWAALKPEQSLEILDAGRQPFPPSPLQHPSADSTPIDRL